MTSKTQRPKRNTGALKALLLTSSMLATLAGTQILNIQAALQPTTTVANNSPVTVEKTTTTSDLPVTVRTSIRGNTNIRLAPITQAVQPQFKPVARSRSSK